MTKRELINKLEALPIGDEAKVLVWDADRDAYDSDGESPSTSLYEFGIDILNDNMTEEEKEYHRDIIGSEPEPFIVITFDNPDYADDTPDELKHA